MTHTGFPAKHTSTINNVDMMSFDDLPCDDLLPTKVTFTGQYAPMDEVLADNGIVIDMEPVDSLANYDFRPGASLPFLHPARLMGELAIQ